MVRPVVRSNLVHAAATAFAANTSAVFCPVPYAFMNKIEE